MSSSVIESGNPQQATKKSKEKNKDLVAFLEERLAEINATIFAIMGRVEDVEKRIEELESMEDPKEL